MAVATQDVARIQDDYLCPHCRQAIRPQTTSWRGWQNCPFCGAPSLPPPVRVVWSEAVGAPAGARAEAWIASGDLPDETWPRWSRASDPLPVGRRPLSRGQILASRVFTVGMMASAFVLLVGLLDLQFRIVSAGLTGMFACHWLRTRVEERRSRPSLR